MVFISYKNCEFPDKGWNEKWRKLKFCPSFILGGGHFEKICYQIYDKEYTHTAVLPVNSKFSTFEYCTRLLSKSTNTHTAS